MKKAVQPVAKKTRVKLEIVESRMLMLLDILKQKGRVETNQDFCDKIGMHKQTLNNIKQGRLNQKFIIHHVAAACKVYNVNANFILGIEDEMFRTGTPTVVKKAPVKRVREVVES
jgi:hypothetical protein